MYTEESKYSGEDNNFNRKLTIFNDLCNRVGIPQEAKIKGFPTILRGITLNFYYKNKATCKLCRVWECINDLIVNIALKPLYIHEEGRGNKV